ncbi:hypothetical protein MNBD_NITROSPINAE01-1642 [hydrothermal vent metagenome]|uniref:Uncharacterized protein n=1 Tax=hydrothermal vent metagenome TaxID=652676 RepID=A0A3B1BKE2_9ZZZZ
MATYKDLLELIAKREFGIIGEKNTRTIYASIGLALDDDVTLEESDVNYGNLEKLMGVLKEKYGMVAIIGCKIPAIRMAKQSGLELPDVLR